MGASSLIAFIHQIPPHKFQLRTFCFSTDFICQQFTGANFEKPSIRTNVFRHDFEVGSCRRLKMHRALQEGNIKPDNQQMALLESKRFAGGHRSLLKERKRYISFLFSIFFARFQVIIYSMRHTVWWYLSVLIM